MNSVTQYLAAIGRRGGKARGGAKAEAARVNGLLGGRPKEPNPHVRRPNADLIDTRHDDYRITNTRATRGHCGHPPASRKR
jgi:hypothetical protein